MANASPMSALCSADRIALHNATQLTPQTLREVGLLYYSTLAGSVMSKVNRVMSQIEFYLVRL